MPTWFMRLISVCVVFFTAMTLAYSAPEEGAKEICTQQAVDAGLNSKASILEYVEECISLLPKNEVATQDAEAPSKTSAPQQN